MVLTPQNHVGNGGVDTWLMEAVWGSDMERVTRFLPHVSMVHWRCCIVVMNFLGFIIQTRAVGKQPAWSLGVEAVTKSAQVPSPQHVSGRRLVWGGGPGGNGS